MVVTCLPAARLSGVTQDRVATPSRCTVQAPHWVNAAAILGASHADPFPQHPEQWGTGIGIDVMRFPIDGQAGHLFTPSMQKSAIQTQATIQLGRTPRSVGRLMLTDG